MGSWSKVWFFDMNTVVGQELILYNDLVMVVAIAVLVVVGWFMLLFLNSRTLFGGKMNKYVYHNELLEIMWTMVPSIMLCFLGYVSLMNLYIMEVGDNVVNGMKVTAHQWYWSYDYIVDFSIKGDKSYELSLVSWLEGSDYLTYLAWFKEGQSWKNEAMFNIPEWLVMSEDVYTNSFTLEVEDMTLKPEPVVVKKIVDIVNSKYGLKFCMTGYIPFEEEPELIPEKAVYTMSDCDLKFCAGGLGSWYGYLPSEYGQLNKWCSCTDPILNKSYSTTYYTEENAHFKGVLLYGEKDVAVTEYYLPVRGDKEVYCPVLCFDRESNDHWGSGTNSWSSGATYPGLFVVSGVLADSGRCDCHYEFLHEINVFIPHIFLNCKWNYCYEVFEIFNNLVLNRSNFRGYTVSDACYLMSSVKNEMLISTTDVMHSWGVGSLGVKCDAVPGRVNSLGISPLRSGVFYGNCYELCGEGHSMMPIMVAVMTPGDVSLVLKSGVLKTSDCVSALEELITE